MFLLSYLCFIFSFKFLLIGHPKINMSLVKDKFSSLVRTHFLHRSLEPVKDDNNRVISLQSPQNREELFQTPLETEGIN